MLNLKNKILQIFAQHEQNKSPEAETNLILFSVFRNKYQGIRKISDLFTERSTSRFPVTQEITDAAMKIAQERIKGIPLQYIIGNQFFFEHDYTVNSHVLIPRPETEILINHVIDYVKKTFKTSPFRFAELGLGSGILSTEILFHFKSAIGLASEVNPQAIAIARQNLDTIVGSGNWEERFSIIEPGDSHVGFEIFEDYRPMDLVISNPPYLSVNDEIDAEVLRYEPHTALFPMLGGSNEGEKENPSFFYENFLHHHKKILKPEGTAFFEIPHERAESLIHEFKNAGFFNVNLISDLTGRSRILVAKR